MTFKRCDSFRQLLLPSTENSQQHISMTVKRPRAYLVINKTSLTTGECVFVCLCVCRTHHASLCSEDDDLVERRELLEQVVDARTLLKPPTCRQLETQTEEIKIWLIFAAFQLKKKSWTTHLVFQGFGISQELTGSHVISENLCDFFCARTPKKANKAFGRRRWIQQELNIYSGRQKLSSW